MTLKRRVAWLSAILAALSILLTFVACDGRDGDKRVPTSGPTLNPTLTPTLTLTPTPTPGPTPTPTPHYDVEAAKEDWARAKQRWESEGSNHYTIVYDAACLACEGSIMLTVRYGVVESMIYVSSGESVGEDEYRDLYRSIDDQFKAIFRAIEGSSRFPPDRVRAAYHHSLGYPVSFGYYSELADGGYGFNIHSYEPFDPSEPPKPLYDVASAKEELSSAKALWEARGSDDYNLRITPLCECPEDSKALKIAVRNGAIEVSHRRGVRGDSNRRTCFRLLLQDHRRPV